MNTTKFKFRDNGGNSFIVYALNRSQAYAEAKKAMNEKLQLSIFD
jgi:hypothetical protein